MFLHRRNWLCKVGGGVLPEGWRIHPCSEALRLYGTLRVRCLAFVLLVCQSNSLLYFDATAAWLDLFSFSVHK